MDASGHLKRNFRIAFQVEAMTKQDVKQLKLFIALLFGIVGILSGFLGAGVALLILYGGLT